MTPAPSRFVMINGGTVSTKPANAAESIDNYIGSSFYSADTSPVTVASFYIARKELTYGEWQEVCDMYPFYWTKVKGVFLCDTHWNTN